MYVKWLKHKKSALRNVCVLLDYYVLFKRLGSVVFRDWRVCNPNHVPSFIIFSVRDYVRFQIVCVMWQQSYSNYM